ncbi:hypothetical protein ACQW08_06420 [Gluconobacter japonicus]|uniref:glycine-rich domain-containing protein n=1 Tax=Gluconobacter japonicus TaxID=376620 RepID=UPI003D2E44DD
MDYINAPGTVVDAQGRRQFANQIPGQQDGTDLDETVFNPTVNEIVHCIEASGQTRDADDETQLWQAISKGRLLRIVDVQSSQMYTPGSDARWLIVEVQGPGGGSGGALGGSNNSNPAACGSAGAAGGYVQILIDLGVLSVADWALTIGSPGQGFKGAAGSAGGATSFGSIVTCDGGSGGSTTGSTAAGKAAWSGQAVGGDVTVVPTAGLQVVHAYRGANGGSAFLIPNSDGTTVSVPVPAIGPGSPMGTGGDNGTVTDTDGAVSSARGFGSGAGGTGTVGSGSMAGGSGAPGRILIREMG